MRRKDILVTDISKIVECLDKSTALHVGISDSESTYVFPVNFGYELTDTSLTIYFHGAKQGRKAELAASSPNVGFCCETDTETLHSDTACGFTEHFLSIIGTGRLEILENDGDKISGLNAIMKKVSGKEWEYPAEMLSMTNVYRITADEYSCKENR